MNENQIQIILSEMNQVLNNYQIIRLKETLNKFLSDNDKNYLSNEEYVRKYMMAKKIEGLSNQTLKGYQLYLDKMIKSIDKNILTITADDLREFLSTYQKNTSCKNTTIENIRVVLSSFFSWLEIEEMILKNPVKKIHKIKVDKLIKEVYSDEVVEILKNRCNNIRNKAIISLLSSSGIRVGELVRINIDDIDFNNYTCKVFGKGNKEREVYFDVKTKLFIQDYLSKRQDNESALFVSNMRPYTRLGPRGVELMLQRLAEKNNIRNVYPHKFRRTLATKAIDKGMPIEQVQRLLGHTKIDTTLHYAQVNQSNVKYSYNKYIS